MDFPGILFMRVLLVEDNPILSRSLTDVLTSAKLTVDCMHDGESADYVLRTQDYAMVILDIGLPKLDGLEVLRRLRARRNAVPVLMLTAHGSVEERVRGLDLGADDYLAKPFALTELEARARALLRRSHGQEPLHAQCGRLLYDSVDRGFTLDGEPLALTPRERSVLEVLILRNGRAINKDTLSEKIFGLDESVNADAIEIYVHRLRKKLERSSVGIVTLRGLGYLLEAKGA
ncbi:winged helix family two component transcriptional regulator [Paraburkholderia sp. BL23I1N1]|uniref:response regulator n=1 Tax=Paraburkholderia sp. BL23I1N1 TaxID=1938802 RepID=UPI000E72DA9F|nr:response regulator [Paraburkholderia sp. BL23I1N1]RKE38505.1 winged helix family two component transcriptional regulator [Paraburkholderia sp. BL23I1N1]